jgi:hypothetical protein
LSHPRISIEANCPVSQAGDCRQKANARTAVFEPQFGPFPTGPTTASVDRGGTGSCVVGNRNTESLEAFDHHAGVVAVEHSREVGGPLCKSRDDEGSICDAFGAGWPNRGADRALHRIDFHGRLFTVTRHDCCKFSSNRVARVLVSRVELSVIVADPTGGHRRCDSRQVPNNGHAGVRRQIRTLCRQLSQPTDFARIAERMVRDGPIILTSGLTERVATRLTEIRMSAG